MVQSKKGDSILIYDLETQVFGKPNPAKDRMKLFGCYSYIKDKIYVLKKKDDIQRIINAHKFLVGFNTVGTKREPGYDNPILIREGINLKYKIMIDLMKIFKERAGGMKIEKGMLKDILMSYSLDYITRTIGIVNDDTAKGKIDYSVFLKETWTAAEEEEIRRYAVRDIEVTKKLYEWVEDYFEGFKPFLHTTDVKKKSYLTVSLAKFAYKAICKAMKWEEKYGEFGNDDTYHIKGGYVAYPAGEKFEGDIFCLDFNSLYPHAIIQCNLFGRKKEGIIDERNCWTGSGKWKVNGIYYSDELAGVGQLLKQWYRQRLYFKKIGDKREYTIKIILNTTYGILISDYYSLVFDKTAGGDCTRLGRQWILYARKIFRKHGYPIAYTDTDSLFIVDIFKDKEKMLSVKNKIIDDIKRSVSFPQETFDMGIDDEITHMFFFKGKTKEDKESDKEMDEADFIYKPLGLIKKNYVYVAKIFKDKKWTDETKIKIKNLDIVKKSVSPLSKKIFWDYIVPRIKQYGEIKYSNTFFKNLINDLLSKDIKLAMMRKDVGPFSQYEKTSSTSLQAQISKAYGSGIHFLIPNTAKVGVGKGKNYCTLEEFKKHNLRLEHIDLQSVWSELNYFIRPPVVKNIFDYEVKNGN